MKVVLFSSNKGDVNADLAFQNKFDATGAPGATDDAGDGYQVGSVWVNVTGGNAYVCVDATAGAAVWNLMGESGIDPTELALLNGAVAGSVVASKAAAYGSDSLLALLSGTQAGAGTNQATATTLTNQFNAITGADGTVGVALPAAAVNKPVFVLNTNATSALKVYPVNSGNDQINAAGVNTAVVLAPGAGAWFVPVSAVLWYAAASSLNGAVVGGVAAGYKVARGTHQQAAASDTIVTGLATVVAVVASFKSGPTVKQLFLHADIGDQAGTPAAGSFLLNTYKPTAVNDVTPVAATDFTDNVKIDWVAVGT